MASSLLKTLKLRRPPPPIRRTPIPPSSPFSAAFYTTEGIGPPPSSSIPPQSAAEAARDRGRERGTLSKLLLFLPGAISFGLGTWQIVRGQEKIEMIGYRRKRLEMDPVSWNSFSSSGNDLSSLEFRKVVCEGVFDESNNIYVGPRSRSISGVTENGYYVITPLVPTSKDSNSCPSWLTDDGFHVIGETSQKKVFEIVSALQNQKEQMPKTKGVAPGGSFGLKIPKPTSPKIMVLKLLKSLR